MDGIMQRISGNPKAVANLVAVAPMVRALESLGLPVSFEADLKEFTRGFPAAVTKNLKLLNWYLDAMRVAYQESQGFSGEVRKESRPGGSDSALDPGEYYLEMGCTLAGLVMSQLALPQHPLFYIGFPITPAGNPFYAMAAEYANGHPYIMVDENNPSEKVAAEKLLGVAPTGGALPVTFTASQGWRLFAEIMPQLVGARLECLFVLCRRALAAPALNIEESHTDRYVTKGPVGPDKSITEAMTGKAVSIYDVASDPRATYPKEAAEEGIKSILSVPIALKGKVIGVMRLYTSEPRDVSDDEITFMSSLAEQAALAIENARLYQKLKGEYEELMGDLYRFTGFTRGIRRSRHQGSGVRGQVKSCFF